MGSKELLKDARNLGVGMVRHAGWVCVPRYVWDVSHHAVAVETAK